MVKIDDNGSSALGQLAGDATGKTTTTTNAAPLTAPAPQPRSQAGQLAGSDFAAGARIKNVLDLGMSFLGQPYKWGGSTPQTGFDCSGLLQYIYAKNGVAIPRVSRDQARAGVAVAAKDAQPGDLIAFDNDPARPGVDHIGIYLGNGKMLQSPHTGANIEVVNVNLGRAAAIRRVVKTPAAFSGLSSAGNGKYVYDAKATAGATRPTTITPAKGGGDDAVVATAAAPVAPVEQLSINSAGEVLGPDGKPDPAAAMAQYGFIAELAKTVPDIKRVLTQAINGGWTTEKFTAAIQTTAWWKKTAVNQRQNEILKATDPQAYREKRQGVLDTIVILGRQLGVPQDNPKIEKLADRALAMGWNQDEIKRYVAADIKVTGTSTNSGAAAVTVDALKSEASDWMVPLSDATLQTWTRQILSGDVPADAFTSYLKTQAKSLMPALADDIDRGVTVKQYVAPYAEYAGQILERDPNTIDFLHDPKMSKALFTVDPKTNQRTPMSLADWQTYLRGLPDYQKTAKAKESAADFATSLATTFGKVA